MSIKERIATTYHTDCYTRHHDCAVSEVNRLRRELAEARELLKDWMRPWTMDAAEVGAGSADPWSTLLDRTRAFLTPSPPAAAPAPGSPPPAPARTE